MITPINIAEAIIEPFWDPQLSGIREWTLRAGEDNLAPPPRSPQAAADAMPADHYDYDAHYKVGSLGAASGIAAKLAQTWCNVAFSWERSPKDQGIIRMSRHFDLPLSGYDRLLISLALPEGAGFRIPAETDLGLRALERAALCSGKLEASLEYSLVRGEGVAFQ